MSKTSVPVVMYHSVGIPDKKWQWNYLTCPYEIFENHLIWLKKYGFNTITLQQLFDYMNEGTKVPKKSLVLTFDDGYLDNWVFAYPLLKKYGFKCTIYVNPEFVDYRNIIRNNLEDVWNGNASIEDLHKTGSLSWDELKEMEKEGVVDIQSHSMTHTWYPISDKIIDFRHPGDSYGWITWNNNLIRKPFLRIDDEKLVDYGEPVYEHERSIGAKKYFPDNDLKNYLLKYVQENGGNIFFESDNWKCELFKVVEKYKEKHTLNENFETDLEYEKRIIYELSKSKKILESKLCKSIEFLCWPGGVVTETALNISKKVGYKSSTAGRDIKSIRKYLKNTHVEDPSRINRIGVSLYWNKTEGLGSTIKYKSGFCFILSLKQFQSPIYISPFYSLILLQVSLISKFIDRFFKHN